MSFEPQNPYPIVGILQYAASGVTVKGINMTAGGSEEVTTAEDGSYLIDPANMANGYSDGDVIHIQSGSWYRDVRIDLTNYPEGKIVDLKMPARITFRGKGASKARGITIGKVSRWE